MFCLPAKLCQVVKHAPLRSLMTCTVSQFKCVALEECVKRLSGILVVTSWCGLLAKKSWRAILFFRMDYCRTQESFCGLKVEARGSPQLPRLAPRTKPMIRGFRSGILGFRIQIVLACPLCCRSSAADSMQVLQPLRHPHTPILCRTVTRAVRKASLFRRQFALVCAVTHSSALPCHSLESTSLSCVLMLRSQSFQTSAAPRPLFLCISRLPPGA